MTKNVPTLTAQFAGTHFVDEKYHQQHSQLIHRHDDVLELLYVMQGTGSYIVRDHAYPLQPGNLVVCNAGILHGEPPNQKHTMQSYCCVLRGLTVPGLPPNTLMDHSYNPVLYFSSDKPAAEHILMALRELSQDYAGIHNMLANALLNMVYIKLQKRQRSNDLTRQNSEELIQNITAYLDEHFTEPVSLPELGSRFHMSHYYLSHVFKSETGLSPMKYVLHRKIGEAQNLLMNTTQPLGEIGERLGFSDSCHFSSMFKKYIGITPSKYRQHFQTNISRSE